MLFDKYILILINILPITGEDYDGSSTVHFILSGSVETSAIS